jgi:hypothetical protein
VDVNRDGRLDLFFTQGTDSFAGRPNRLLINRGSGRFRDESATRLPDAVANSTKTDWGDLDGNGTLDAAVANLGPEQLLLNNGRGVFTDASASLPPAPPLEQDISAGITVADADGDRDLDILVSNENPFDPSPDHGAQNRIWINDGRGRFTDETAARFPAATDQTAGMLTGDIDRNGSQDIIVLNRGQDRVLINNGGGYFADETAARFPVTADATRSGALVDLNGDRSLDLILANSLNQPMTEYLNNGAGVFTAAPVGVAPQPEETNTGIAVADIDHRGGVDAYVGNAGPVGAGHAFAGGPDRFLTSDGSGMFTDQTARYFPALPADPTTAVAFGDVDGDCRLDLVAANSGAPDQNADRVYIQHAPDEEGAQE